MMRALFDDQAASGDGLTDKFAEAIHRAISVPRHVVKQFERMAADREAEQIGFRIRRRSRRVGSLSGMPGNCSRPGVE